ncbi:hypothetical protein FHG87_014485 [Trinorchestia longiramus]|nr:hypothetical protein FHG87_014485 [Trinorchestia longiramus]
MEMRLSNTNQNFDRKLADYKIGVEASRPSVCKSNSSAMAGKLILALALVLLAASSASARRAHANDYVNAYYSRQKVMEFCFGRQFVRDENTKISAARASCRNQPTRATLVEPKSKTTFEFKHTDEHLQEKPYFTQEMVRYLSERALAKTSNLTCVLRELGYMDENDHLNYDHLIAEINAFSGGDAEFKSDLITSVNGCKDMANCLPLTKIAFPLTPALMRWSNFSKCHVGGVYQACIKKDLREHAGEFELDGLGNFLSDSSDSEKMYGVIWARTVLDQGSDFLW